jgi:glycosyltransferase involved in cell wall biosynthesis
MPVEAMAAGTPVIVRDQGGASESVALTAGGLAVSNPADERELRQVALAALDLDMRSVPDRAMTFDRSRFVNEIRSWVGRA